MKKWLSTLLAITVAASCSASVILISETAQAKPEKASEAKPNLSSALGALKWGMPSDKAKKIIADKIMEDFTKKSEGNTDLSYIDNLRKKHNDRVEATQKSYMVLTRDNSAALSVSIVGEEFIPDAGESLLMSTEDNMTKYYFFKDNKFYKMCVVYDSNYLGPIAFDTFVATTAQKYGPATKEVWDDDGNFNESIWMDSKVKMTVKNKYGDYNTVLMVFADESVESGLTLKHKEYFDSLNKGPEVSSAIDALTADDGSGEGSSIDAMLGKTTKVDLLAGLSQEDIDVINGVTTEKEIEKKKKAKAKKQAKDRKNDAKAKQGLEII